MNYGKKYQDIQIMKQVHGAMLETRILDTLLNNKLKVVTILSLFKERHLKFIELLL